MRRSGDPGPEVRVPAHTSRLLVASAVLVGLGLIAYTAARARLVPYTFDESVTFSRYVPMSVADIVTYARPRANNHILNTLLTRACRDTFGTSELALRLPNLAAHAAYLVVGALWLRSLAASAGLFLAGFIVLNANPYMLDFFSLSRGYGLGLAAMLASLWQLFAYARAPATGRVVAAMLLAAAAVLANFTFAHCYAAAATAAAAAALGGAWRERSPGRDRLVATLRALAPIAGVTFALGAVVAGPVRRLARHNLLYFGGSDGFWQGTVLRTLDSASYGRLPQEAAAFAAFAVALLAAVSAALALRALARGGPGELASPIAQAALLLFVPVLGTLLHHHLFGAKYLVGRTALFFVPLLAVNAIVVANELHRVAPLAATAILSLAAALCAGNTLTALNLHRTLDWGYDANTRRMLRDLEARLSDGEAAGGVRIGVNWQFLPTALFYRETLGLSWIADIDGSREPAWARCSGGCDYYYSFTREGLPPRTASQSRDREFFDGLRELVAYPETQTQLLGRGGAP